MRCSIKRYKRWFLRRFHNSVDKNFSNETDAAQAEIMNVQIKFNLHQNCGFIAGDILASADLRFSVEVNFNDSMSKLRLWVLFVFLYAHWTYNTDVAEISINLIIVHTVADNKLIRNGESRVLGFKTAGVRGPLFTQTCDID